MLFDGSQIRVNAYYPNVLSLPKHYLVCQYSYTRLYYCCTQQLCTYIFLSVSTIKLRVQTENYPLGIYVPLPAMIEDSHILLQSYAQ